MPMTSYEIRKNFLDFFRKSHIIMPSAPIVIKMILSDVYNENESIQRYF